jgi:hypothetical protein
VAAGGFGMAGGMLVLSLAGAAVSGGVARTLIVKLQPPAESLKSVKEGTPYTDSVVEANGLGPGRDAARYVGEWFRFRYHGAGMLYLGTQAHLPEPSMPTLKGTFAEGRAHGRFEVFYHPAPNDRVTAVRLGFLNYDHGKVVKVEACADDTLAIVRAQPAAAGGTASDAPRGGAGNAPQ